ncbi:acyl-CoA N-acyltransferase [Gamsiella multidivaricata]|uniref:acyl-CoA N-acyltransferase n=1 Tax=Gamsiella multidivaricata TaxID=101098 RepID=UPI002220482B|nr:acyl-CoA N-acyltransferase [Gamsiella multidivaricata]KAI7824652.1 acyl-CoA N-acyltransferase [Gamsiella multidivaricata]
MSASDTKKAVAAVLVRRADPEQDMQHVDEIHRIVNAAYRSDAGWTHETHLIKEERITKEGVKDVLHDKVNLLLLAFDSETNQLLGTIQLDPAEFYPDFGEYEKDGHATSYLETMPKENQIFLGLISVDPLQQSRGIGGKLVREGLRYAKETMGRKQAVVYVLFQRTELAEWYKRIGFVDYGEKVPYPDQARTKQEDVHFTVLRMAL